MRFKVRISEIITYDRHPRNTQIIRLVISKSALENNKSLDEQNKKNVGISG